MPSPSMTIEIDGREVRITNPNKIYFPAIGATKWDPVSYYLADAKRASCARRTRRASYGRWSRRRRVVDE